MIETSSVLPWKSLAIFRSFQQSLEIFRKCLEMFVWPSDNFWRIFGIFLKRFQNLRKIIQKNLSSVCSCNKTNMAACTYGNFSSRVQLYTGYLTHLLHSLARLDTCIKLNAQREIPYLREPMYFPLFISHVATINILPDFSNITSVVKVNQFLWVCIIPAKITHR